MMKPISGYLTLLALPLLVSAPAASAAEPILVRAPMSAVFQALVSGADGAHRLVLSRPSGKRALPAGGPVSAPAAAAEEIALGTTPASEFFSELRESLALLTDGTYASAWTDWDGSQYVVWTQWVSPDGSPLFASGGLRVGEADNPFEAAVVANPAGGAFVAYARGVKDPGVVNLQTDFRQVFVQSYDAAGHPLWPAGGVPAVNVDPGNFQDQLHLAPAPDGGVYLCVSEFLTFPTDSGENLSSIRCQRLGAGGERLWSDQGIDAGGRPGWKVLPRLVPDGRDGVLVFWSNKRDAFDHPKDRSLIEGQHLTAQGGKTWGPQGRILRTTGLGASGAAGFDELGAVSDGRGGAVLSFNDWSGRGALALDVYAQRVNGAGRVLWGKGRGVATGDAQQQHDSITAAPDGGAFITVWEPNITSQPAPDRLSLYRVGPDGKVLWKRPLSVGGSTPSDWGAYASFDGGLLRLAWTHQQELGAADIDPYLMVFDLAGHSLNGPSGAPITTDGGPQVLRGLAFDPLRQQGFAVWLDGQNGGLDVAGGFFRE